MTTGAWLRYDSVRRALKSISPKTVLEIGPGLGAMAARLAASYDYTALELDQESFRETSRVLDGIGRGRIYCGTLDAIDITFKVDLVCAFEVLEHIDDDVGTLKTWASRLNSGGHILISVPSGPTRFGSWDKAAGHLRRYSRSGLIKIFQAAGLETVFVDQWGAGLGHLLESARNVVAPRCGVDTSQSDRTRRSGRLLQPNGHVRGSLNAAVAAPFRLVQLPLRSTDRGIGLVALAGLP